MLGQPTVCEMPGCLDRLLGVACHGVLAYTCVGRKEAKLRIKDGCLVWRLSIKSDVSSLKGLELLSSFFFFSLRREGGKEVQLELGLTVSDMSSVFHSRFCLCGP